MATVLNRLQLSPDCYSDVEDGVRRAIGYEAITKKHSFRGQTSLIGPPKIAQTHTIAIALQIIIIITSMLSFFWLTKICNTLPQNLLSSAKINIPKFHGVEFVERRRQVRSATEIGQPRYPCHYRWDGSTCASLPKKAQPRKSGAR